MRNPHQKSGYSFHVLQAMAYVFFQYTAIQKSNSGNTTEALMYWLASIGTALVDLDRLVNLLENTRSAPKPSRVYESWDSISIGGKYICIAYLIYKAGEALLTSPGDSSHLPAVMGYTAAARGLYALPCGTIDPYHRIFESTPSNRRAITNPTSPHVENAASPKPR